MNTESRERIEDTAARWITRRGGSDWTPGDEAELQQWLSASVGHRAAYYRLNAAWQETGRLQALLHAGEDSGLTSPLREMADGLRRPGKQVQTQGQRAGRNRGTTKWGWTRFSLAAGVLAAVAGTWYAWPTGPSYHTEIGGLAAVPLVDGSKITLNTDSEIRVAVNETERRIELERGEAFFEVARDPARPFIVEAGNKRIVAVGTQFSVRHLSSGRSDDTRVLVTEGTVRLEDTSEKAEVLHAGTIARVRADVLLIEEDQLDEIERNLTWRSGQLTFRDTALADAVAEFNRYNTRKIIIQDAQVAALQVGGIFKATNLDLFVRLLEEAFPIRAEEEEGRIVLSAAER